MKQVHFIELIVCLTIEMSLTGRKEVKVNDIEFFLVLTD